MNKSKKYKYKNKLFSIKELSEIDDIGLTRVGIYRRISNAGIKPEQSVTRLLSKTDLRKKQAPKNKSIHKQQNYLKEIKFSLGVTWDELARRINMNPRTFSDYRLPETSKAFKELTPNLKEKLEKIKPT